MPTAESGPQAHAITRWLGIDAPDHTPRTVSLDLDVPGLGPGLLRRPVELLLRGARTWPPCVATASRTHGRRPARRWPARSSTGPTPRAASDNITVALARVDPVDTPPHAPPAAATAACRGTPRGSPATMATFSADVYQNEFLPDGGTDVHAIVTVACTRRGRGRAVRAGDAAEIVIVDTSGSMGGDEHRGGPAAPPRPRSTRCSTARGSRSSPAATRRAWPTPTDGAAMVRMDDADARRGQGARSPASGPTAARRWAPGCALADPALRRGAQR